MEEFTGERLTGNAYTISEDDEHIHHSSVSPDGLYVASVFGNGVLRIFDAATLTSVARSAPGAAYNDLPATVVKWFPTVEEGGVYKLLMVSSVGGVFGWKWDGSVLERTNLVVEDDNEISTADISPDGLFFLTGGSDRIVRLYNSSFELIEKLNRGYDSDGCPRPTHVNRIFSVRFVTATMAISAGWESPAQLWDLRTHRSDHMLMGVKEGSDCVEPIPDSSSILYTTLQHGAPALQCFECITASRVESRTESLSAEVPEGHRLIVSRLSSGNIWSIGTSPNVLDVFSFADGKRIAQMDLPGRPMNIAVCPLNNCAYISCQKAILIVAKLSE